MKQAIADLIAIARINLQYFWYVVIRRRIDLFLPHYEREQDEVLKRLDR